MNEAHPFPPLCDLMHVLVLCIGISRAVPHGRSCVDRLSPPSSCRGTTASWAWCMRGRPPCAVSRGPCGDSMMVCASRGDCANHNRMRTMSGFAVYPIYVGLSRVQVIRGCSQQMYPYLWLGAATLDVKRSLDTQATGSRWRCLAAAEEMQESCT